MVDHEGIKATVHLAVEDATGDSAIIEYIPGGKKTVYHSREYRIMTNDPSYDQQLAYRATFNFDNATRHPEPKNTREAIGGILAIARNVSVPFGAPNRAPGSLYNTEYRTAIDLTNRQYFFELTTSPNVIWMDLSKFDLTEGSPVLLLDPDDINLSGDVTKNFKSGKVGF
jgi:choloylglycine hydrolase